jgi:hypothetical protein
MSTLYLEVNTRNYMLFTYFIHWKKSCRFEAKLSLMKKIFLHAFILIPMILISNYAKSQLIKDEFGIIAFSDQFDDDKDNWRNMSTSDNLFMIQEGEYLLRRKNLSSGYSIFPRWKNTLTSFSLSASVMIEESKSEEAAVGLIFMAQEDASGAFVFEFNPKGQYRLKQLVGLSYKLLTGEAKTGGWVSSDALNKSGEYNLIEIKTAKRNYDIYVNEKYLLSFTEIAYKTGDIGIAIGAGTKAKVDYIVVKESRSEASKTAAPANASIGAASVVTTEEVVPPASSDAIVKLAEQIANLKMENQSLRDSIIILKKNLKTAQSGSRQEQK